MAPISAQPRRPKCRVSNIWTWLVPKKDIRLVLQRSPVDCPQTAADTIAVHRLALVRIVEAVIVDRCQTSEDHRTILERACAPFMAENLLGVERVSFYREPLVGLYRFPCEVAGFGQRSHFIRCVRKLSDARAKFADEEFIV